jgi:hypothetical protein
MKSKPNPAAPIDLAPLTRELMARLPSERWAQIEARAHERVRILEVVDNARVGGLSRRRAHAEVAPSVQWSTYLNWWRCSRDRQGEPWERQLDGRIPPPPTRIPDEVRSAACLLRRVNSTILCEEARKHLVAQFGPERGDMSDASLKRFWKEAGLEQPRGGLQRAPREEVTRLSGGGGLALVAAAAVETGVVEELGAAVVAQAKLAAAGQAEVGANPSDELRDEVGRFTADYNRAVRGSSVRDPRLDPDAVKRARRDLNTLALVKNRPETAGYKLLVCGLAPLVTERRGFDGLENPTAAWLEALGGPAYQDTTLDKYLAELALVDAGETLWTTHAKHWQRLTKPWCKEEGAPGWLRYVAYVDATQEPYWSRQFAASGKVSRVGRVMPSLSRVALMGGPGVPLIMETHAGSVSMKTQLLGFLERVEAVLGEGELGRLTVVDAEMATLSLLSALASRPDAWFVTVLKGATVKAAQLTAEQPWQSFRERDQLRALRVQLNRRSLSKDELVLRGVEMAREGSRAPGSTLFLTNATEEDLTTEEVAEVYLSRWPHQEQRFRDGRNGLAFDRTHGYGGHYATHVALSTKLEMAQRRVELAQAGVETAIRVEERLQTQLDEAKHGERMAARETLQTATRSRREAERKLAAKQRELVRLESTPREIYVRDTTRDNIVMCAKLTALMLVEFVLKEYFGGLRMEPRTFIDLFVSVPVTIRESKHRVVYELDANPRSPVNTERLREACREINRRRLRRRDKLMRFEVVDPVHA